jgi:hypothetical protein
MKRLAGHLRVLAAADVVAFGGVGFAGQVLPVTTAYDAVADGLTADLRPELERLLDRATPAGRVYAATLLGRLDTAAGDDAWRRLAADDSPVDTFTGCVKGRTTVAGYAAARRAGPAGEGGVPPVA